MANESSQESHLLTPLASLWPTATLPETPRVRETAVKPTAPRTVKVTFVLHDPGAKQVFLCGEFNGWSPDTMPMNRYGDGHWETTLALAPGRHEYKFVVDGNWKHDPLAHVNVWNPNGTLNSVAQVQA
jgi:1,4-alpha-glucan branching enzyme